MSDRNVGNPGVCKHGGLRRQCETCDLAEQLDAALLKLNHSVQLAFRPELDQWQADYGDHHALGSTMERAIFELGMYLMRMTAEPPK